MISKARLETMLISGTVAVVLGVLGLVFLAFAGYLALRYALEPVWAALATGAALLALGLAAIYGARLRLRRLEHANAQRRPGTELDAVEASLREHADTLIAEGVRRYPSGSAIGTLLLGIAAGYGGLNGRGGAKRQRRHGVWLD